MMRMTMLGTLLCAAAMCLAPSRAMAQATGDRAGVERAALDYLEGFYEGDADKIRRGVHPDVVKYGFMSRDGAEYRGSPMSFAEMLEYAESVRKSGEHPPASAPKEVVVLEVQDQIAAAKVIAWWGMDYLQMARYDGEWKILHVLWQTPPPGH